MIDNLKNNFPLSALATKINATIIGDSDPVIKGLCSVEESKSDCLTFFKGQSESALNNILAKTQAKAFIVSEKLDFSKITVAFPIISVEDPHRAFIELVNIFYPPFDPKYGLSKEACISDSVTLGENCQIGPFSFIGVNTKIGKNTIIHPNVTIYNNVTIGENCTIHSGATLREHVTLEDNIVIQNGAIIGADGFGYVASPRGLITVPQVGNVSLAKNVDIGANTCIDRATIDSTRISQGTKIDNLVQIGHNTQIGAHSIVCGQSAIAGSAKIGNQVVLGGNVGVADHTEIADGCRFAAFSGLHGKYTEKGDYGGNPALPAKLYRKVVSLLPKIPDLAKNLKIKN